MTREQELENLLAEGLDLCARARKVDDFVIKQTETYETRCGTPHLWACEQYDKELSSWELRARSSLLLAVLK